MNKNSNILGVFTGNLQQFKAYYQLFSLTSYFMMHIFHLHLCYFRTKHH